MKTMQIPWYIAKARREWVRRVMMPVNFATDYWTVWAQVYRP